MTTTQRFKGKACVATDASPGMRRATAPQMVREGGNPVAGARRSENLFALPEISAAADVAEAVLLLPSGRMRRVTGQSLRIDAGQRMTLRSL